MSCIDEYKDISKQDLIDHIKKLKEHVNQLTNIIKNNKCKNNNKSFKIDTKRKFDFSKYGKRHICLKLFYLGWDYDGLVLQENTSKTIEQYLFSALLKTYLIEDEKTCNYNRCGRTDKKVSAFSQIISIDLRSKFKNFNTESENQNFIIDNTKEINYCKILNKVLPKEIRAIAWSPVDESFNARFDCKKRTYLYYFPLSTLNLDKMNKACSYLIGTHNFQNFCKLDRTKEKVNFVRTIYKANITKFSQNNSIDKEFDIYQLKITSNSFLWHQIRFIVTVLFVIGHENDRPELVLDLLDLNKFPKKPQYSLANETSLVLFDCEYESINENDWIYDKESLNDAFNSLKSCWIENSIKSTICLSMFDSLASIPFAKDLKNLKSLQYEIVKELNTKNFIPFKKRDFCEVELSKKYKEKLTYNSKHRRLEKHLLSNK